MKAKFFLSLSFLFAMPLAFAQGNEGGHTGNGGGAVFCAKQAPLILDYFEIPGQREDVIDLEHIDFKSFVELMSQRIALGSNEKSALLYPWWVPNGTPMPVLSAAIRMTLQANGPVNSWKTTAPWAVRDEGVADDLPEGCHFEQAAISRERVPHRITSVTRQLSRGQKRVLELHEALFPYADYYSTFSYNGTSASVRKLVRVLIRKNPSASELKAAFDDFMYPHSMNAMKNGSFQADSANPLYSRTGLYILDQGYEKAIQPKRTRPCPSWLGLVPTLGEDAYLYLFDDQPSVQIREYLLPHETRTLKQRTIQVRHSSLAYVRTAIRNGAIESKFSLRGSTLTNRLILQDGQEPICSYINVNKRTYFGLNQLLSDSSSTRQNTRAVKYMIEHYESLMRGVPSHYQTDVSNLIYFNSQPFHP